MAEDLLDIEIQQKSDTLYSLNTWIQSSSAELITILQDVSPNALSQDIKNKKIHDLNVTSSLFTSSLNELSLLYDARNVMKPQAGFPLAGEKIIRVGETFDIQWNNNIVPTVNIFFMKGGQKIPITIMKEESINSKSFVIDISHFSEEYVPCKIRMESTDVDTIFDETFVFKVLKSN